MVLWYNTIMNIFIKTRRRSQKQEISNAVKKTVSNFLFKARKKVNDTGILDRKLLTYKQGFLYAMECFCSEMDINFQEIMKDELEID